MPRRRACRSTRPPRSRGRGCASRRNPLRIEQWLVALAAFAVAGAAHAGAQKYEVLSASVRASLARAVNERAPFDDKDAETRAWIGEMMSRVASRFPDEDSARRFLAMARYEAMRA